MIEHLSPSTVNSYRTCGRQLYLKKIAKIPDTTTYAATAYGSSLHETIDKMLKDKIQLQQAGMNGQEILLQDYIGFFKEDFEKRVKYITVWGEDSPSHLLEQGEIAIKDFMRNVMPKIKPVEAEKTFLIERDKNGLPIKCIADCVTDSEVWDWKTGRGFGGTAKTEEYALNMATYALGFKQEYGRYPMSINVARVKWSGKKQPSGKKRWYHKCWEIDEMFIPEESLEYYLDVYEQAEKGIQAGVFFPIDKGTNLCKNCSYRGEHCNVHMLVVKQV